MLEAVQGEIAAPPSSQQPTKFWLPTQEEISTIPLNPSTEEAAPDDSLPFTQDVEEDNDPLNCLLNRNKNSWMLRRKKRSMLNLLLQAWKPSSKLLNLPLVTAVPGNMHVTLKVPLCLGTIKAVIPRGKLAVALVEQDLSSMSGNSLDTPPTKKPKPDDGAPSM